MIAADDFHQFEFRDSPQRSNNGHILSCWLELSSAVELVIDGICIRGPPLDPFQLQSNAVCLLAWVFVF